MRGVIQVGEAVGPFTIVAKLGRGGMSTVYSAYEAGLDREVALKVLPIDLLEEPGFADRFEREARLIAKLEHPHIVPLYSYGIDDGIPWMALRLVRGGNLSDRLGRNAVGREAGLAYFTMIADALDHAHHLGVVHRDLKPQNVLLGEHGELYLADFGISRLLQGRTTITSTGAVLGTPQYMSPEQAQDSQVGPATDIYALGVMVYQWLTGLLPFDADTPFAVMFKHVNSPLETEPLRQYPERVQQVLVRALSKQPEQRWPSAGGFMEELAVAMGAEDLPGQVLASGRLPPSMAAAISSRKLNRLPPAPTEILRDLPTPTAGLSTPRPRTPTPPAQPPVEPAAPTIVRPGLARGPAAPPPTVATPAPPAAPPAATPPGAGAGGGGVPPPAAPSPPPPPAGGGPVAPGELQFRPRTPPPKAAGGGLKWLLIGGGALLLLAVLAWLLLRGGDEAPVEAAPVAAPVETPAEPEAPAEPPPLPAGDGRLLLESDLDCELSINGLKRGELKANTPLRLEIAPGRYPVACVSPAHPDVVSSQVALVTRDDPTVALFELKYEIDQRERQRQEQERRRIEQEKADALARQQQEDREAAEARRLVEEARRREDERKAEEERTLQAARQAAERRRREEELKLEEARRAAAARRTGQAPATTAAPAAPAAATGQPGVAAQPDEAQARQAQARRQAEAKRKADEEAAAKAAAEQLAAQQRAEAEAAAAAAAAAAQVRRTTPIPVSTPQPDYPKDALRAGITGAVEVQITIGRDGRVTDVRVLQSRPRGEFDREVVNTVRAWRFEPLDEEVKLVRNFVFK